MKANKEEKLGIDDLIKAYNLLVKGIEAKANEDEQRAYGGVIRAGKGLLVESLAKRIIEIAWNEIGGKPSRLSIAPRTIRIPIKKEYITRVKSPEVIKFIKDNIQKFHYDLNPDIQVCIDNKLLMVVECKAYTENAMLKRILVDFTLLKQVCPDIKCALFQLESQLGGDYSKIDKKITLGSYPTHTLMSYFDIELNIITLLESERRVDKPIHKAKFYKELKKEALVRAVEVFKNLMKDKL